MITIDATNNALIHDVSKRCFANSTFLLYMVSMELTGSIELTGSMELTWSIELTRLMEYIFLTALKYVALSYCNCLRHSYPISTGCKV